MVTETEVKVTFLILALILGISESEGKQCIDSKIGSPCFYDEDCFQHKENHLYCNKTGQVNICAFQIETYASRIATDKDCPGLEFSAEPWSDPIGNEEGLENPKITGLDCMRRCLFTETCFAAVVLDHQCYLRNDKCMVNLRAAPGATLGVLSIVREDFHCGCHYPFIRRRSNGEILSWEPDCPESQSDRSPYRCCSQKGLCIRCAEGQTPPPPMSRNVMEEPQESTNEGEQESQVKS